MKKLNEMNEEYVKPEIQVLEMNPEGTILAGSGDEGEQLDGVTLKDYGNWNVWGN